MPLSPGRRFLLAAAAFSLLFVLLVNGFRSYALGHTLEAQDWLVSFATALVVGAFGALLLPRRRRGGGFTVNR